MATDKRADELFLMCGGKFLQWWKLALMLVSAPGLVLSCLIPVLGPWAGLFGVPMLIAGFVFIILWS